MSERFSGTEEVLGQQSTLAERLQAHPQLQQRIEALLDVVENRQSDAHKADEAEQKVIEELRQIGQQALQSWAETQLQKQTEQLRHSQPSVRQHRKKNSTGTPEVGQIEVTEQVFRQGKGQPLLRPFSQSAAVGCRGYSSPLQRVITDFGADVPFGRIPEKLKEHYGVRVPMSSAQMITEHHATLMLQAQETQTRIPHKPGVGKLIVQMDGSMIPIVETKDLTKDSTKKKKRLDRRKTRRVGWREARLCLAHPHGCVKLTFAGTLGTVDEAGDQLFHSAIRAGLGNQTRVHSVGDGAPWIATQVERLFGQQGTYLIDFYHLCDYLAAASEPCAPHDCKSWMKQQKQRMKANQSAKVLAALKPHLESDALPNDKAPVRACYRYLSNRPGQFDYQAAMTASLPIGSGKIESAHRYVIQERLKLAGSWWKIENATSMLALRILRANGDWDIYWHNCRRALA